MASVHQAATAGTQGRVSIPPHVVYRTFVNETVVMNLNTGTYHGLNVTGGQMLDALEQCGTVAGAAAEIAAAYGRPRDEVEADLWAFCGDLAERDLLAIDAGGRAPGPHRPFSA